VLQPITDRFALLHWLANMDFFLQQANKAGKRGDPAFPMTKRRLI
jgi:hypothetical protein